MGRNLLTDEEFVLYMKGIEEGKVHASPSPETRKHIDETMSMIKQVKADIDNLTKTVDRLESSVTKYSDKFDEMIAPNVNSWNATSQNQSRVVWIILTALIGGLIALLGLK